MIGRPQSSEAAPYYSKYIDRISSDDIVGVLGTQVDEAVGTPLPSFDQNVGTSGARADNFSWASHVEEFNPSGDSGFFRNLPAEAWPRGGIASGNAVTVRALAYILAGHVEHHIAIIQERYLASGAQA